MRTLLIIGLISLFTFTASSQSTAALQTFEDAVNASRNGDAATAGKKFETTLALIERGSASDAFFAKVHYNIGVSRYQLGDLHGAAAHFEQAIRYSRQRFPSAQQALGLTLIGLDDLENAERTLLDAVKLDNRNADSWLALGRLYLSMNDHAKAKRAMDRARKLGAGKRESDRAFGG